MTYPSVFGSCFHAWKFVPMCAVVLSLFVLQPAVILAQVEDRTGEAIALFNKGQDAHEKGDLAEAVRLYEQAVAIIPEFPEAELQRGNALVSLGRTSEAEKAFRRAVELRADWTIALASLGSLLVQSGRYPEAERVLLKSITLDELNFPAFAALTELKVKTNAKPEVLRPLLLKVRGLTEKPRAPASVWAARAALEGSLGDYVAARKSAATAVELDPKSRFALSQSVSAALALNDPAGAEGSLKLLEALAPDAQSVKLLRVRVLLAQGNTAEASKILDSAPRQDADTLALKEAIRLNQSTDAAHLEKLLESDPQNISILGRLCSTLRTVNPEKSAQYCRRAFELEPQNIGHAIGYGAALLQAKRYDGALSVLSRIVASAPENATAHANLATALFQLKRFQEAKAEYRWLVDRQPNLAAAYYFLAITHDQLGEYLDAMANYQQFLRLADPAVSRAEIERVNLRLPSLQKQIRDRKGKKNG